MTPQTFARQVSTLDHLTHGRLAIPEMAGGGLDQTAYAPGSLPNTLFGAFERPPDRHAAYGRKGATVGA